MILTTTLWFSPKLPVCTSPAALQGFWRSIVCIATASRDVTVQNLQSTPFASQLRWRPPALSPRQDFLFCVWKPIASFLLARNFERERSNNHTERKEGHKSPGSRQEQNTKPKDQKQPHPVSSNTEISSESGLSQNGSRIAPCQMLPLALPQCPFCSTIPLHVVAFTRRSPCFNTLTL